MGNHFQNMAHMAGINAALLKKAAVSGGLYDVDLSDLIQKMERMTGWKAQQKP